MPEASDCISPAPSMAPAMVPTPPESEVPPMTAAAITSSSSSVPVALVAAFRRAVEIELPMATRKPISMNTLSVTHLTLMPASSAASGLPPSANT